MNEEITPETAELRALLEKDKGNDYRSEVDGMECLITCRDAAPALLDYIDVLERALEIYAERFSDECLYKTDTTELIKDVIAIAREELEADK